MALNYAALSNAVAKVLRVAGGPVTITYASGGNVTVKGVIDDKLYRERVEGGQVQVIGSVKHLYLPGTVKVPEPLDEVQVSGTRYVIAAVTTCSPAGQAVYHDVTLRG